MNFEEARGYCCDHARELNESADDGCALASDILKAFRFCCGSHPGQNSESIFTTYTEEYKKQKESIDETDNEKS